MHLDTTLYLIIHDIKFHKIVLQACLSKKEAEEAILKHRDDIVKTHDSIIQTLKQLLYDEEWKKERLEEWNMANKNIWSAKPVTMENIEEGIRKDITIIENKIHNLQNDDWTIWSICAGERLFIYKHEIDLEEL